MVVGIVVDLGKGFGVFCGKFCVGAVDELVVAEGGFIEGG